MKTLVLLSTLVTAVATYGTAFENDCATLAKTGTPALRLKKLEDRVWKYLMQEYPEFATSVGFKGQDRKWTDQSLSAIQRRQRELDATWKVLKSVDRSKLSPADQLNYDLMSYQVEHSRADRKFPGEFLPVSQMAGVHLDIPMTLSMNPKSTVEDYENILARLEAVPALLDQITALLKEGSKRKLTYPRIALQKVPAQIEALLDQDPAKNPLLEVFQSFPQGIKKADQQNLSKRAKVLLEKTLIPSFARFHTYFQNEYLPSTREEIGWTSLKNGEQWYAQRVEESTTTKLSPETIHKIGLEEVRRLRQAMEAVQKRSGFKGSTEEFNQFLRTDPRFYYQNSKDLLTDYRDLAKRIDAGLPALFGKLPRLTYGVSPIPEYAAPGQPAAYYLPGSPEGGRSGTFFANTYDLASRPKWEMAALTLHEAVPGHHLQIALGQELEGVPDFRRHTDFNAFVEGWGLYAESLGDTLGVYTDPYLEYGRLCFEIWRSVRLVVDTGMHSMGWSREKAIKYFHDNSGRADHDIEVEVDRYLVMPGQALGYKIGQLRIQQLRADAEQKLGPKFSLRGFHDAVLEAGALPLDILDKRIAVWIREQSSERRLGGGKREPTAQNKKHPSRERNG